MSFRLLTDMEDADRQGQLPVGLDFRKSGPSGLSRKEKTYPHNEGFKEIFCQARIDGPDMIWTDGDEIYTIEPYSNLIGKIHVSIEIGRNGEILRTRQLVNTDYGVA